MKCSPCCLGGCAACGNEGERRKLDAFALLTAQREVVVRRAQRALLRVLIETGSATADDVRELVELPPGVNAKCFGAAPSTLARLGVIRADGYAKTCRPTAHARPVTIWALADREKAERWLRNHPDMPDPGDNDRGTGSQAFLFPPQPINDTGAAVAAATPAME